MLGPLVLPRPAGSVSLLSAHRGACDRAPENTLAAFEAAVELGAEMVELDVHPTADGRLVVLHDVTTDRTTGRSGRLDTLALAELRELDAGAWFGPPFVGQRIPMLSEVLAWARGRAYLDLDVRNYPHYPFYRTEWMADVLVAQLRQAGMIEAVVVQCLDHRLAQELKRREPCVHTGLTQHGRPVDPVSIVRAAGADLVGLDLEFLLQPVVDALHAADVAVMVTVEPRLPGLPPPSAQTLRGVTAQLMAWGVDVLVTDDTASVRQLMNAIANVQGRG